MGLTQSVTTLLSILTIAGQIIFVISIISLFFAKRENFLAKNGIILAFIVALIATAGSLFYSEIAGFTPCKFCWFQRIFMYPQVILLGIAFWKKYNGITDYILPLSVIGTVIAAYHYLMQIGAVTGASCAVIGQSAACSQRFVMNFGYITIPMMALTAFLMITMFMILRKRCDKI